MLLNFQKLWSLPTFHLYPRSDNTWLLPPWCQWGGSNPAGPGIGGNLAPVGSRMEGLPPFRQHLRSSQRHRLGHNRLKVLRASASAGSCSLLWDQSSWLSDVPPFQSYSTKHSPETCTWLFQGVTGLYCLSRASSHGLCLLTSESQTW